MKSSSKTLPFRGTLRLVMAIVVTTVIATGCLPTVDKDLPPLSDYQSSESWYEDAFIRVYRATLPEDINQEADRFTHPWIVLKPMNSDHAEPQALM